MASGHKKTISLLIFVGLVRGDYAENEKMQLNLKKCKEMLIDFRRQKTTIPHIYKSGRYYYRESY